MDIAKIRKKAREKEAAGKSPEAAEEPQAREPQEPEQQAGQDEAPPDAEAPEGGEPVTGLEEEAGPPEAEPPAAAPQPAREGQGGEDIELLTFTLAQEEFAFRVPEVEEIIRHQKITQVPTMPGYVCGITSLRGKIIPVIDLKARLILRGGGSPGAAGPALEGESLRQSGKILILAGPKGLIGATIDRVLGVVRFPQDKIFEPPSHLSEEELQYIEGVVTVEKRFISIIRAEAALTIEVS